MSDAALAEGGAMAEHSAQAAPVLPIWKARYDRWVQCPGSMAMENAVAEIPADDVDAFQQLGRGQERLPLQILVDGATAALMHLNPGSVCLDCRALETCPREVFNADDLV